MRKKVRDIIRLLEEDGWYIHRQKGSHKQYRHPSKKGLVTVPDHGKNHELDHFLVSSIFKQAGLK
jgi:predicted RNA binding protein YcfA (HicA-like mRNA interferase family)